MRAIGRRSRVALAAAAALVAFSAAACGSGGGGSPSATSADPCAQIADDAVASWRDYQAKHGDDLANPPEEAKDDLQALQDKVQQLETEIKDKGCKPDDIGRRIQEQAPDFLGLNRQNSTTPPTTAP